ncbi:hypothetical protein J6590_008500 [Homalodisca vitripennis]|nr:hypothetical protein J6590_008500 [Homalodisca vitripennis]
MSSVIGQPAVTSPRHLLPRQFTFVCTTLRVPTPPLLLPYPMFDYRFYDAERHLVSELAGSMACLIVRTGKLKRSKQAACAGDRQLQPPAIEGLGEEYNSKPPIHYTKKEVRNSYRCYLACNKKFYGRGMDSTLLRLWSPLSLSPDIYLTVQSRREGTGHSATALEKTVPVT